MVKRDEELLNIDMHGAVDNVAFARFQLEAHGLADVVGLQNTQAGIYNNMNVQGKPGAEILGPQVVGVGSLPRPVGSLT